MVNAHKISKASKIKTACQKCHDIGCLKILPDGTCLAFSDPNFQWQYGECYGAITEKAELEQLLTDITGFSKSTNTHDMAKDVVACLKKAV